MKERILLVEDDLDFGNSFAMILKRKQYHVHLVNSAAEALNVLVQDSYSLIISDVLMPEMSGLEFLKLLKEKDGATPPVIMLTGYGSVKEAVEAMKIGAYSYFLKPANQDEICMTIEKALEYARLKQENVRLKEELSAVKGSVLTSSNSYMKNLLSEARTLAQSDVNVLITGESGTGKEVMARYIHDQSKRRENPFLAINCQAYVATLMESELFGYKGGSFTGASAKGKPGKFELVSNGTLFLDEIGELEMSTQIKLLRVLENREIEPVGGLRPIPVKFRLISATNRNLEAAIGQQAFRDDLYYRINTVQLHLPPLRERMEDIIPLARHFLQVYANEQKKSVTRFTAEAERRMLEYKWPGNIRQLKNTIEGAVALAKGSKLDLTELRLPCQNSADCGFHSSKFSEARQVFERDFLCHFYKQSNGNISAMSRLISLDRKQLYKKLSDYQIIKASESAQADSEAEVDIQRK